MEYGIAEMTGGSQWAAAYQKAKALVSQMTLEEKVRITHVPPVMKYRLLTKLVY